MSLNVENGILVTYTLDKAAVNSIKLLASIAPKRTRNPMLETVRLASENGFLYGEATDLDVWLRTIVSVNNEHVLENLSVIVPVDALKSLKTPKKNEKTLLSILNNGEENTVLINSLTVKGITDEYPKFPEDDNMIEVGRLENSYFDSFSKCAISASKSEVRPTLLAVCHRNNYLIATDGLRLTRIKTDVYFESDILVSASASKTLSKVFKDKGTNMSYNDRVVKYTSSDSTVYVRKIAGTYPDVSRIIPQQQNNVGTIKNSQEWISTLKEIESFKLENGLTKFTFNENSFNVEAGNNRQKVETKLLFDGASLNFAVNTKYLREALEQTGDNTTFIVNGERQPVLLTSQDEKVEALVSQVNYK